MNRTSTSTPFLLILTIIFMTAVAMPGVHAKGRVNRVRNARIVPGRPAPQASSTVTVTITSGSPVSIITLKAGDKVNISATLNSNDPNENSADEGEPLMLQVPGGSSYILKTYEMTADFNVTAPASGPLTGYIKGADGDESATITVTLNSSKKDWFTEETKSAMREAAENLHVSGQFFLVVGFSEIIIPTPFTAAVGVVSNVFGILSDLSSITLSLLARDPPDPNFTVIAQPIVPTLPTLTVGPNITQAEADTLNALVNNQGQIIAYAHAIKISVDRAQGASDAGNTFWETKQVNAINAYSKQLAFLLAVQPGLMANTKQALQAAGLQTIAVSPTNVLNFEKSIASKGLSAAQLQTLTQFGATSAEIDQVRRLMIVQDTQAASGSFPDRFTDPVFANPLQHVSQSLGAPTSINPIDESFVFVRQHYLDFLSRDPDTDGLGYWATQITPCGIDATCIHNKRIDVSDAFFYEQEFQQTGAYVYRIYKASFGKPPTFTQYAQDHTQVIGGPQLDQSKTNFALNFVQRTAFVQAYPRSQSASQFVDAMLGVLKKNSGVDLSSQRAALISLYNGTDNGRAAILRRAADTQAVIDAEYNRSFILAQYFGYLRRDPDQAGYDFWLGKINQFPIRNIDVQHALVCSFITSAEYQKRFGPLVTHTNQECPK